MKQYKVSCICDTKDRLGEGPVWVEEQNSVFWVDIKSNKVHKLNLSNNHHLTWNFNESIGCIAHIKNNLFIAGTKTGFKFLNLDKKELVKISDPEKNFQNNRFNDGKCDNQGRFYAGTMDDFEKIQSGNFYILYKDLNYKKFDSDYFVTNGPTFSPDYKTIYFTDSKKREIYCSNLNIDGTMKEKKVFIKLSEKNCGPDGMTVDSEGCLWVAIFGGSCVNRYNTQGKLIDKLNLPVSCVTSCVFGGKNLDTLFITTASFKLNEKQKKLEPLAGSLFSVKTQTKGLITNKFIKD